jgi:protease-4
MALDSDYFVDRKRLKRRLASWRIVAVLAVIAAVAAAYGRFGDSLSGGDHIARVDIEGVIVHDDHRLKKISDIARNVGVKAVIIRINSPGGTVVGGETLHKAFIDLAAAKPVVALIEGIGTSAAYMTAIAADRIYVREATLTGSIGVLLQTTEVTGLLEMIGVSAKAFKSGSLKAVPSPLEPLSPEVEAATQSLVTDMYTMFRDMVLRRRGLSHADEKRFSDGRAFTGRQALAAGLVDEIGGEEAAVTWLETTRDVPEGLKIRNVNLQNDSNDLIGRLYSLARKTILSERLTLDGLISLWHPQLR